MSSFRGAVLTRPLMVLLAVVLTAVPAAFFPQTTATAAFPGGNGLIAIDLVLTILWLILLFNVPLIGILIAPLAWAVIIVPDIVVYIAIHLRYDTTWYVLSDRTLRIRRGICRDDGHASWSTA